MHEPLMSESAVWQRGLTLLLTLLCLWGVRCKPSLLLSGLCIYGIDSDMLADASPLVEFGSCCNAKCLAIVHYKPALWASRDSTGYA